MSYFDHTFMQKNKFALPVVVGGVMCGLLVMLFNFVPLRWATLGAIGLIVPFVALMAKDTRWFFLGMLFLTLPLQLDTTFGHTGHLGGAAGLVVSLSDIILGALYLLWFVEIVKRRARMYFFPEVSLPYLSLCVVALLSMGRASYPELAFYELVQMVKIYFGFLYVANSLRTKREVYLAVSLLLCGLFLESLLGLAQYKLDRPIVPALLGAPETLAYVGLGRPLSRVTGTWASYNDFAWYLTFVLPIGLSLLFTKTKPLWKALSGLVSALGISALVTTLSRAGWLSLLVAILVVLLANLSVARGRTGLSRFASATIGLLIVISVIVMVNPQFATTVDRRMFGEDYDSARSRIPLMQVAWNIIKANPLIGIGLNNYTEVMQDYATPEINLQGITSYQVHNIYLQIAAEMGIPGLAVFLWLIWVVLKQGLIYLSEGGEMAGIVIGLLAGNIAFLLHGFVDATSLGNPLFLIFWLFGGCIIAIRRIGGEYSSSLPSQESFYW